MTMAGSTMTTQGRQKKKKTTKQKKNLDISQWRKPRMNYERLRLYTLLQWLQILTWINICNQYSTSQPARLPPFILRMQNGISGT